jgi:hypothetical protein
MKKFKRWTGAACLLAGFLCFFAGLLVTDAVRAGNLAPTNAPGPTMHTLKEIYQKVDNLAPQALRNLSEASAIVEAGVYAATNLTLVDPDLGPANIATNVTIFGVTGTYVGSDKIGVPKTGQTSSYRTGDDGDLCKGVTLANPRFTVQANTNCVMDNLTRLIWARNANLPGDTRGWNTAISYCNNMNSGAGTYGYTDWRLPNVRELLSLFDYAYFNPALPPDHPFTGLQSAAYWSSTTVASSSLSAWLVNLNDGEMTPSTKANASGYVWPVCGGQ